MTITSGAIPKALPGGSAMKKGPRLYTSGVKAKPKAKRKPKSKKW